QFVFGEARLDITAAVTPRPELLHDPGREAYGRIHQARRQCLRARRLDSLVPHLVTTRGVHAINVGLLCERKLVRRVGHLVLSRIWARAAPGRAGIWARAAPGRAGIWARAAPGRAGIWARAAPGRAGIWRDD